MSNGAFTKRQRDLCWARCGGYCEICGYHLPEKGWNLHHRRGRGMGGSRRAVTCADGLAICGMGNTSGCHKLIDEQRQWAISRGFVIPRSTDLDASAVAVLIRGEWRYLTAGGNVIGVDETTASVLNRGLVA